MFGSKRFIGRKEQERFNATFMGRYLQKMKSNSLLYFGVPFFAMMYIGLNIMTQFSELKYENIDRRQTDVSQSDALKKVRKRTVNLNDEFYRLQHMDLDNWEQKRVPRLKGESENKWD